MGYSIVRYDLDKCYRFREYNEASAYAQRNMQIKGVKEQYQKLIAEKDNYVQDIKNITGSAKEDEDKKYNDWGNWHKKKTLCARIILGLVILTVINIMLGRFLPSGLHTLMTILSLFLFVLVPAYFVMKMGVFISEKAYYNYIKPIGDNILIRGNSFAEYANKCYAAIDDLYLLSLEPAHREMVMMRREQAKQHEEVMRMERERIELEKERIRVEKQRQADERSARAEAREEAKQSRKVQERLLQIEEDRELRYRR